MAKTSVTLPTDDLSSVLLTLRGQRVILAPDLAALYGVEVRRLNEQVKRNQERFPTDFVFQLTAAEVEGLKALRSQIAILKRGQHFKYRPYAFTEHGALMAANVLNSPRAVAMSVYLVRAFIRQRETLAANAAILKRLVEIDRKLLLHDSALHDIYQRLKPLLQPPPDPSRPKIGFTA